MYILSFDIEDWFHIFHPAWENKPEKWQKLPGKVEKNTHWILDFLDESRLKATFFVLGWVAKKYPGLVKDIAERGHEIAAHSYLHNKVYSLSPALFNEDTRRVIETLEQITGKKITAYRAPGFSMNKNTLWAFETLHKWGIEVDSSFKSGLHMGFTGRIPNEPFLIKGDGFMLKEFPTRTFNFFGDHIIYSGSGYFRLYPYHFVQWLFNKSGYEMSYFHPRDFDNDVHHYFKGFPLQQLRYRVGTNRSRKKFRMLVNEFDFMTMHQSAEAVDWDEVRVIDLLNGE